MSKAFIPTPMSQEELVLIYKAVQTMVLSLKPRKHLFKTQDAIELTDKYIALEEKLKNIMDMADAAAEIMSETETPTYSEREED